MSASISTSSNRPAARSPWAVRVVLAALLAITAGLLGANHAQASTTPENPCPEGNFCVWNEENHAGQRHDISVNDSTFAMEQCVPLAQEGEALSFVNNTGHHVTVYQDQHCDTEGDFATYPPGSQAPKSTYVPRAIKVWSH
ncbi:peptidase inhibitor family I36 protein [Saccharopolyspora sp. NPDC002376]